MIKMPISAGDLIASGHCSPACLLALEIGGKCRCRCEGVYHGILAGQPVEMVEAYTPHEATTQDAPWFARYTHYSEQHLDTTSPGVADTGQFNKVWAARKRSGRIFSVACRVGRFSWTAQTDAFTARDDYREDMRAVGERLVVAALVAKSSKNAVGETGPTRMSVGGLRSQRDAQVLACAFSELWFGNPDGALGLHCALREDITRESHRPRSAAWLERERMLPPM